MKMIRSLFATGALFALAGTAQAIDLEIGGITINVGSADTLVGWTGSLGTCTPGSSPTAETCWADTLINPTPVFFEKEEKVQYYETEIDGTYAFEIDGDPGYYLIKNATYWALFQNLASLDWAVFSTVCVPGVLCLPDMNLGGSGELIISHVTSFNGTREVPEPTTLGLYGLGVLGVYLVSRRRQPVRA